MNTIDIEKLNQLISRTDISGNDKVRWLTDFIDGRELQLIENEFYSEEEVLVLLHKRDAYNFKTNAQSLLDWQTPKEWFEQFKNK